MAPVSRVHEASDDELLELLNTATDIMDAIEFTEAAREAIPRLVAEKRAAAIERDRIWCRALTDTLPAEDIERVTKDFNRIRPDPVTPFEIPYASR